MAQRKSNVKQPNRKSRSLGKLTDISKFLSSTVTIDESLAGLIKGKKKKIKVNWAPRDSRMDTLERLQVGENISIVASVGGYEWRFMAVITARKKAKV